MERRACNEGTCDGERCGAMSCLLIIPRISHSNRRKSRKISVKVNEKSLAGVHRIELATAKVSTHL
jgi:hypothetical protein